MLCVLLSVVEPHVKLLLHTNGLCTDYITAGALLFLFLVVIAWAPFYWPSARRWFTRSDLVTAYVMLIVASAIPSHGLLAPLYPVITGIFYYATPENQWAELIHPHLPNWIAPTDPMAIKHFFEGAPDGQVPWGQWIQPFIAWGSLILVVFFVMICLASLLRRQWIERERLLFPLTRLPLALIEEDEHGHRPLLRNGLFWVGFGLALVFVGLKGLHFYYHFIPVPNLTNRFMILRNTTRITIRLNFAILGLSYLLALNVGFSIWFFHLLIKIESGLFAMVGLTLKGHPEAWGGSSLATTHQNAGALIVLVVFGLWMARDHLKALLRKAFMSASDVDDANELLSYRTAVFGVLGGLVFIGGWLSRVGIPWPLIPVVLGSVLIVFVGLSKIVAQAGVGFMCTGISPPVLAVSSVGTTAFGLSGLVGLGTLYTWAFEGRTLVLASVMNGLKLSDEIHLRNRRLLLPILTAIVLALVVTSVMILQKAYAHGGINLRGNWFFGMPHTAWRTIANKILNPITGSMVAERWAFIGIGGGFMLFLMYMGTRFIGWPFHYIGFPVADIWMMNHIWFNVFLAWMIKLLILRYGGLRLYRRALPFFLGLILGQIAIAGFWMGVDACTGAVGNFVDVGLG